MSFFKSIGKSISNTVKAVSKDIVPIAAAVATGGTSLAVLKPTNVMERIDKATGLPVSSIYNAVSGGGGAATQEQVSTASVSPQTTAPSSSSIYDTLTPYLNSFLQASQKQSSDVQPNASIIAAQPVQQSSGGMPIILIGGGLAAILGLFLIFRKK